MFSEKKILLYEPYYDRSGHFKKYYHLYFDRIKKSGLTPLGIIGKYSSDTTSNDTYIFKLNDRSKFTRIFSNFFGYRKLKLAHTRSESKLIHLLDFEILTLATFLLFNYQKLRKTKIVLSLHSTNYFNSSNNLFINLYSIFAKFAYKLLDKLFDVLIVTNGSIITNNFTKFVELKRTRIVTSSWGSDIKPSLHLKKKKNSFLFLGIIRRDKNPDYLIREMAKINKNFSLTIAGHLSGYTEEEFRNIISKSNIPEYKVNLQPGFLSSATYLNLLETHQYIILPYKPFNQSSSGPLIDAIQTQTLPIVSNFGERGYIVNKNKIGFGFDFQKNHLSEIIREILLNPESEKINSYTKNIKKIGPSYTWDFVLDTLITKDKIYED
ncbi:MAG: glycosyltransferase [Cyanothece sp. SIO1E1]|nr:glycosyltransferase [Cyanothece sp. SIO1E1]